jgi:drug/metabolite transporter (DMT)-like permease
VAHSRRIHLLLALLLILWSANFIFVKLAVRELPLGLVLGLRYVLAAVLMAPVYLVARDRQYPPWRWRDAPGLFGVGFVGLVGNQLLFVTALSMTSVAHGAVITAISPILVLLGAAAVGQEQITARRVAGMAAAAAGIAVLQLGKSESGGATWSGDALMLASAVVLAAYNLAGRGATARFGSLALNAVGYLTAGVLALPLVASKAAIGRAMGASAPAWAGILYMAAATSVAGYLIYTYALGHLPASRVASLVYLQPVLAAAMAMVVLGEHPGAGFVPAVALVLGGVYVVERPG